MSLKNIGVVIRNYFQCSALEINHGQGNETRKIRWLWHTLKKDQSNNPKPGKARMSKGEVDMNKRRVKIRLELG